MSVGLKIEMVKFVWKWWD